MIYTLNNQSYLAFDQHLDLAGLAAIKEQTCLAFAKNTGRLSPTSVGGVGNWPDGSEKFLPKNEFTELSAELNKHYDTNGKYNKIVTAIPPIAARVFVKLVTDTTGVGSSLQLNHYTGPADKRYRNKHISKLNPIEDWAATDFRYLLAWLKRQDIFCDIGRIILFFNDEGQACGLHRDYNEQIRPEQPDQFIWINLFPDRKKFYLLDPETGVKHYINHQVAMFDSQNWHGSDSHPLAAFSIRVDGVFNDKWLDLFNLSRY